RSCSPNGPASPIAAGLAGLGHEVHVLLLPPVSGEGPGASGLEGRGGPTIAVHHLPSEGRPNRRPGWLGRLVAVRVRRAAVGRALREIGPQVVHLADEALRGIPAPAGAIVLRSLEHGPCPGDADAA